MTLEIGSLLNNRYRIESIIAQGGMGALYRATDESLGVAAAVKENLFITEDSSRQFRREATILAGLRHPNLPRVTDHFVIPDQGQYLVMDYIDGDDIKTLLAKHETLPEKDVVKIGIAICDALSYLHSRQPPIIHRDIKPGNIKITPGGQIYLVDFGLAKESQAGQSTTVGAQALTPGYAPPEQYGKGTEPRSDQYALGATLYAALTGMIPEDALARAMQTAELSPIRKLNPKISPPIAAAIERAMSVNIDERYPNAEGFRLALGGEVSSKPKASNSKPLEPQPAATAADATRRITPAAAGAMSVPPKPQQRSRLGLWIGLAIFLVLIGAGGSAALLLRPAQPTPLPATATLPAVDQQPTETASPTVEEATATSTSTPQETPTLQPSPTIEAATATQPVVLPGIGGGSGKIAFVKSADGGKPQVFLLDLDTKALTQFTKEELGACQPSWSPDGQKLVIVTPCQADKETLPNAKLVLLKTDGTRLTSDTLKLKSSGYGDFFPAWSPDGTRIAFSSQRDSQHPQLYVYSFADNQTINLFTDAYDNLRPAWSPDSLLLAYESNRSGVAEQLYSVAADDTQRLTIKPAFPSGSSAEMKADRMPVWSPDGGELFFSQSSFPASLNRRIYPPKLNGERTLNLTFEGKTLSPLYPRFSPDGEWLLIEGVLDNRQHDIYLLRPDGSELTRLTDGQGDAAYPVWVP